MTASDRVLIVGGGPVGIYTGLALARADVPVTIFDALAEPARDHRAATLQPSTLELIAELGVIPAILEQGLKSHVFQWRDLVANEIIEFDYGLLAEECPYPYVIQLEQHRTVLAALSVAASEPSFDLQRPVRVLEVRHDADGAEVDIERADGTHEAHRGRYLIGCDGGSSLVRKTMSVSFEGFTWPERFNIISTTFDFASLGFRFRNYCPHPERWTSFMKVPGDDFKGLWRCVFPAHEDESDELVMSDAWVLARLQERFADGGPYPLVHRNMYPVHQRVAGRFVLGRLAIAGDSAHVNNPVGGIGMNSGIQDGLNLARKLIAIWNGAEAEPLLNRYDRQRRETAVNFVQAQSIASKKTLEERDPAVRENNIADLRHKASNMELARDYVRRSSLLTMWRTSEATA